MNVSQADPEVASSDAQSLPPIDFGWLILGQPDELDMEAIGEAHERVGSELSRDFPDYDWRLHLVHRADPAPALRAKPVELLEHGILERDRRAWDFALVLTASEIVGLENAYTLGVPSQSIDVAAVSTARIDPLANGEDLDRESRKDVLVTRLVALVYHLFGHLNGLDHDQAPRSWMRDVQELSELDVMDHWTESCSAALRKNLAQVADLRLEERPDRLGRLRFYASAIWLNSRGLLNSIASARPWLFPFRLSRFTAAASSALFILLVTAEVWEVGLRQSAAPVLAIAVGALSAVTLFMLARQRLLITSRHRGLTEQIAVTNVAVVFSVAFGLLTTFAILLVLTLMIAWLVVPADIVTAWSAGETPPIARSYLVFAAFVTSLAVLIGALGASFEEQSYLRHVAYVDEEM